MFDRIGKSPQKYRTPDRESEEQSNRSNHKSYPQYPTSFPKPADDSVEGSLWGESESEQIKRQNDLDGKD